MTESSRSKTKRAPTLVDVAAAAGVSVSTAGRVLRGNDHKVAAQLAERVERAARRLGYAPNIVARNLRGGGHAAIGLVVGGMLDPYYAQIAEAVTQHAEAEHSMVAIVSNMQRDPLLELKHCRQLWEHRVAGLILAGGGFDQWSYLDRFRDLITQIVKTGVVVVSLSPRGLDLPTFSCDNVEVGHIMALQLVKAGHRRVGVLLGPAESEATQQRMLGATRVLRESGAGFRISHGTYTPDGGVAAVAELLSAHPDLTGFLVGSDAMAVGVLNGLRMAGREVPRDASVVSVGNTGMATWASPRLTTVDVAVGAYARHALDHIVARVKGRPIPDVPRHAPTVIEGGSLGPPPRSDD